MADLNPKCRVCKRAMVFIGHSALGPPWVCPKDCSECAACKRPDAQQKLVSAETVDRQEDSDGWWYFGAAMPGVPDVKRFHVVTSACTKCGAVTVVENLVPGQVKP